MISLILALIDYRGFRLECVSYLPIDDKTLVYGSSDGGNTVYVDHEDIASIVDQVAGDLNLKEHTAPNDENISFPADSEVHVSRVYNIHVTHISMMDGIMY